jgi:hypothetical protein
MTWMSWARRFFVAGLAAASAACITPIPQQTASTVRPGVYRLGGQTSVSPWCGVGLDPVGNCAAFPRGLPVPEGRLNARHGLGERTDLGLSAHLSTVASYGRAPELLGSRAGLFVDAKHELWERPLGDDRRQLLSAGLGLGVNAEQLFSNRVVTANGFDLALPLWFGHQTRALEWVVSPRFVERFSFVGTTTPREVRAFGWFGLTAGFFTRSSTRLGVTLDYFAPTVLPTQGAFTLNLGLSWDVGGRPPEAG